MVFAGDAYLASQLSHDRRSLGTAMALLDGSFIPDPGSRPERGLALARASLAAAGLVTGDIPILSDGGGLGPAALDELCSAKVF